jgi:hypothetical protein
MTPRPAEAASTPLVGGRSDADDCPSVAAPPPLPPPVCPTCREQIRAELIAASGRHYDAAETLYRRGQAKHARVNRRRFVALGWAAGEVRRGP